MKNAYNVFNEIFKQYKSTTILSKNLCQIIYNYSLEENDIEQ